MKWIENGVNSIAILTYIIHVLYSQTINDLQSTYHTLCIFEVIGALPYQPPSATTKLDSVIQ